MWPEDWAVLGDCRRRREVMRAVSASATGRGRVSELVLVLVLFSSR
jgi:hypothetical protein